MFSAETLFFLKGLIVVNKPKYKLFSNDQLHAEVEKVAKDAADIIGFSVENTKILLHHFKWNAIKMTEKFYEADSPAAFLKKNNITLIDESSQDEMIVIDKCHVCEQVKEIIHLSCPHQMCIECRKNIIANNCDLSEDKEVVPMFTCAGCEADIPETFILQLFNDVNTYHSYQKIMINSFVSLQSDFKWCPNRKNGCDKAVKIESDSKVEEVTCTCGFTFCFSCEDIPHSPFPCILIEAVNEALLSLQAELEGSAVICDNCNIVLQRRPTVFQINCRSCGGTNCIRPFHDREVVRSHLGRYKEQSDIFKREYKQLRDLDDVKDDEDDNMVFIKLSLRCLHNFRQQILPFHAFFRFFGNAEVAVSSQLVFPGVKQALKLATQLVMVPICNRETVIAEPLKTNILDSLISLKIRIEPLLQCYKAEEIWKFSDKELEIAFKIWYLSAAKQTEYLTKHGLQNTMSRFISND